MDTVGKFDPKYNVKFFRLIDGIPQTLEEIANDFDCTRQNIWDIKNKSLEKLKTKLQNYNSYGLLN